MQNFSLSQQAGAIYLYYNESYKTCRKINKHFYDLLFLVNWNKFPRPIQIMAWPHVIIINKYKKKLIAPSSGSEKYNENI